MPKIRIWKGTAHGVNQPMLSLVFAADNKALARDHMSGYARSVYDDIPTGVGVVFVGWLDQDDWDKKRYGELGALVKSINGN